MQKTAVLMFAVLCFFGCMALGTTTYLNEIELRQGFTDVFAVATTTTKITLVSVASLVIVGGLVGGAILSYIGVQLAGSAHHRKRTRAAEALAAERDAHLLVTVAAPGSQAYLTTVGTAVNRLPIYTTPLHLAPGRVNGELQQPNAGDVQRWGFFQLTQSISRKPESALELPEGEVVPLPDRVALEHYVQSPSLRSIFLGVGRLPDGRVQPIAAPLEQLVHIGTGGAPGFGKSTFMQSVAYQVLNAREHPQVVMLDPQSVTFSAFSGDERITYSASEPGDIALILAELVKEMQRRQQLFGRWRGIQNLSQYNQTVEPAERLAPVAVCFDEFGLISDHKEVASYAKKLSQGGRKSGLSLVVGTQHWHHSEISTAFRGDLSTRIQFYTRDRSDSRILLGASDAADITRKGQAFAVLPGQPGLIELQAPDPAGCIDATPELLPETASDPLANLKDRLDADDAESAPDFADRVIELWEETGSFRAVAKQMFGYTNGVKIEQVKQVLIDNGIIR